VFFFPRFAKKCPNKNKVPAKLSPQKFTPTGEIMAELLRGEGEQAEPHTLENLVMLSLFVSKLLPDRFSCSST